VRGLFLAMTTPGQVEKKTQQRAIKLFRDALGYEYLGDSTEHEGNSNIEEAYLRAYRQNLDNQQKTFIQPFFSTMQLLMACNDSEGPALRTY
jgi:hypothetical protein